MKTKTYLLILTVALLLVACTPVKEPEVNPLYIPHNALTPEEGDVFSLLEIGDHNIEEGDYELLSAEGHINFSLDMGEFVIISENTSDGADKWINVLAKIWLDSEELTFPEGQYYYHYEEGFGAKTHFFTLTPFEDDPCLTSAEWNSFLGEVGNTSWIGENEFLTHFEKAPATAVGTAYAYIYLAEITNAEFEQLRAVCPIALGGTLELQLKAQLDAQGGSIYSLDRDWSVVASTRDYKAAGFFGMPQWETIEIPFGKQLFLNRDLSMVWTADGLPELSQLNGHTVTFEHLSDQDLSGGIFIVFWNETETGMGAILYHLEAPE